jgi:hypothetical protein
MISFINFVFHLFIINTSLEILSLIVDNSPQPAGTTTTSSVMPSNQPIKMDQLSSNFSLALAPITTYGHQNPSIFRNP